MPEYHSAIKITFTQIVLIAAIKWFLYNTIKDNTEITLSLKACFSWGGGRQTYPAGSHRVIIAPASMRGLRLWFCKVRRPFGWTQGRQERYKAVVGTSLYGVYFPPGLWAGVLFLCLKEGGLIL